MKKNVLLLLVPFLFLMATQAQAQGQCFIDSCCIDWSNFYAKIFGGANFLQSTTLNENRARYNTGYVVAGSLGYDWCDYGLRLEAEYAYRRNAINRIHFITQGSSRHGYFQTSSYMANVLWDLPLSSWGCTCWNIQPFVGAGLGYDFHHMHATNSRVIFRQRWDRFSWQAMAGLACPIWCNTDITLEYKFHHGGGHFYNHAVGVGLVYNFDFIR